MIARIAATGGPAADALGGDQDERTRGGSLKWHQASEGRGRRDKLADQLEPLIDRLELDRCSGSFCDLGGLTRCIGWSTGRPAVNAGTTDSPWSRWSAVWSFQRWSVSEWAPLPHRPSVE